MKLLRFATVALLAGGILVACDDDEPVVTPPAPVTPVAPPAPEPVVGSVSGTVSVEGSGLSGVNVGLVGAASQTATTGDNGGYSFSNVPGGTHGVQISGFPAEVAFVSTASVVTIATSGQNATADFSGNYIRTSTITGTITAGSEGVVATVTATGAGMLMSEDPVAGSSNTDGDFELTGLRSGTYHVTISDFPEGLEFPVTTRDVTVGVGLSANVSFSAPGEDTGDTGDTFIFISNIESGRDEGATAHKGQVTVTATVERGTARFEKIELMVNGHVVDVQSFGVPAGEPEGGDDSDPEMAAAQQVFEFKLGFNSAAYDEETGAVTYENGSHDIQVGLHITGSETALYSNMIETEFENPNGFVVTADLGDNHHSTGGKTWYGGPSNGAITVTALPVRYSGGSVSAVSVTLCGSKDAKKADGAAAFSAEFDCKDHSTDTEENANGDPIALTADGDPGNILNEDDLPAAYIDNVGPDNAPIIIANRNGREMGWINAAVGLEGKYNATSAKDNWLVEGEDESGGVGGYNMAIRIGKDLEAAVGDDATSSLPAESEDTDDYCAVAVASDDLGNMTELPDADDDTCRAAPEGADTKLTFDPNADAGTDTISVYGYDSDGDDDQDPNTESGNVSQANNTLEFGVDTTDPVVELVDDEADMRFAVVPFPADGSGLEFDVNDDAGDDVGSDLLADGGLLVKVNRRTVSKTDCAAVQANGTVRGSADKDCEYMAITDDDVNFEADSLSVAYYTVSAIAKDKAGNTSSPVSHTLVYDATAASGTPPAVPGSIEAGKPFQGSSYLNDNLSIRDYYGTMDYGSGTPIRLGVGAPVVVDAFNSSSLTRLNHQVSQTVGIVTSASSVADPYKGLQTTLGGTIEPLSTVTIFVRDQAQAAYGTGTPSAGLTLTKAAAADDGFAADAGFASAFQGLGDDGDYEVCGYAKCTDDDLSSTLNIRVRAAASAAGSFGDPYERVDFWVTDINGASWLLGSDTSGTSGRVGGTGGDARNRTWTYSIRVPGTTLRMATRPGTGGTETAQIRAIGVNDEGVGLVTTLELAAEDFGTEDTSDDD